MNDVKNQPTQIARFELSTGNLASNAPSSAHEHTSRELKKSLIDQGSVTIGTLKRFGLSTAQAREPIHIFARRFPGCIYESELQAVAEAIQEPASR